MLLDWCRISFSKIYTQSSAMLPPLPPVNLTTTAMQAQTNPVEGYSGNLKGYWHDISGHSRCVHQIIVMCTYWGWLGLTCILVVSDCPEMIDIFLMTLALQHYLVFIATLLWQVQLWYGLTILVWFMWLWQVRLWQSLWQSQLSKYTRI